MFTFASHENLQTAVWSNKKQIVMITQLEMRNFYFCPLLGA